MNREETIRLLGILSNAYPNTNINDASSMASTWEMCLGEYPAEQIYKAARLHMETSKFFPTPAEIREKIVRAELVYRTPDTTKILEGESVKKLEGKNAEITIIDDILSDLSD